LNARQADAVRVEWEDSQEGSRPAYKRVRTTRNTAKASSSNKTARTARKEAIQEQEDGAEAVSDEQPAIEEESPEERRRRKGKAPVRPRPPPAQRPSWESVPQKQRLVSDDEASNPHDSDYEVSS
jgi:hypothetical protein